MALRLLRRPIHVDGIREERGVDQRSGGGGVGGVSTVGDLEKEICELSELCTRVVDYTPDVNAASK